MYRLNKLIKSFGNIKYFINWENDVINANQPVLVNFHKTWCPQCKRLAPILELKAIAHPNVTLINMDTDLYEYLTNENSIEIIPTVILFLNGRRVGDFTGLHNSLDELFQQIPIK
ncbi:unnamed protein product [Paramecium sonneborni]|uniref:Thioredoxin domain-containing protein n=1 Tax=Paramecium sonneborni TaxID=65129 RepID=A0A8S1MW23_9CILI|nr:unnamed protein product [Paramecium sonneborni]